MEFRKGQAMNDKPKDEPKVAKPGDYLELINTKLDHLINRIITSSMVKPPPEVKYEFMIDENLAIPPEALEILQEVINLGAKKGHNKWWELQTKYHLECAGKHVVLGWEVTKDSKHLNHAFCRLMMAAVIQRRKESKDVNSD